MNEHECMFHSTRVISHYIIHSTLRVGSSDDLATLILHVASMCVTTSNTASSHGQYQTGNSSWPISDRSIDVLSITQADYSAVRTPHPTHDFSAEAHL